MADETTSTLSNWLYDMKGPFQENFSKRQKLLGVLKRDTNRANFDGLQVRVPQLLTLAQGTGGLAETGTVNPAQNLDDAKALIPMARVAHAISLSPDLIKSAEGGEFAKAGGPLKLRMQQAEVAMPRVQNEMVNVGGAGLAAGVLATATATTTAAAITLGPAFNAYQHYVGRVLDIVTVATGVPIANGSARTITAVNKATGVVTLDGASTVAVTAGTHGTGIQGCSGNAIQSIGAASALTGTFEGIDKAAVPQWQGVDGRSGDTTAADLSIAILNAMERAVVSSGKEIDFYLADRAVVDKFTETLLAASRWDGATAELKTGFTGVKYRDKIVVPEDDAKPKRCIGIAKEAITLYAYDSGGPDWDEFDGLFKRFSRTLPVEAWLVDYVQLGVHVCNSFVFADDLNQAA